MNNSVSLEASQIVAEAEYNPFFFLSTTVGRTELFSCPFLARATKREAGEVLCKVGGAGDRFGDDFFVDCIYQFGWSELSNN